MSQQIIFRGTAPNDGTGDTAYVFTGKANANFTELYAAVNLPIILANVTGTIVPSIAGKTNISKIFIGVASGSPTVKCGTTIGGNEIFDSISSWTNPIEVEKYFAVSGTIYFTISGGNVNIQINTESINI